MISLYSGTPGSGKSCHAAREIALRLQRKDSVVIGNFYFNTKAVKKCKGVYLYVPNHRLDPDKLLRFSRRLSKHLGRRLREGEVKIYIDEAQLLFNSREYASPDRRAWLSFFSQHRHYGYDVILLAQFDRMLDRQIRGLIEYDFVHRKISNAGKIGNTWSQKPLSDTVKRARILTKMVENFFPRNGFWGKIAKTVFLSDKLSFRGSNMLDKRQNNDNILYHDMPLEDQYEWFGYTHKKFLHNIDTFYYSVKFRNDFRLKSKDPQVEKMRKFFKLQYSYLNGNEDQPELYLPKLGKNLYLKPVTFSRFYTTCLSYPEYFDIFLAPVVPKAADGGESVTCECVVQIRSYMLWIMGVKDAFENSYEYVKNIAAYFGLEIDFVQENRVDYCWHSNYLKDPETFFSPENFYKMRVDRFKNATYVTNKVGSEDYEIDYVALGKRSDKVFVRIYQKTREVIEQNYKPWFFQIWEMNGLISKYDKWVYERCYQKKNWFYRYTARLEFFLEHGQDPYYTNYVRQILDGTLTIEEDALIRLADKLTPKLNYVVNVEYQTMRRHSKSYDLIPFKDHRNKGECKRIYDYLDNRKLIIDYLTERVFKMVEKTGDSKKYRRPYCGFWKALRSTRCIDMKMTPDEVKLVRNYNRKLSVESMKKRVIGSAVTLGIYMRGINEDSPLQDCFEALLRMNDNDIMEAQRYKQKKLRQFNEDELSGVFVSSEKHRFRLLDESDGTLYDYDSINNLDLQGGNSLDHPTAP